MDTLVELASLAGLNIPVQYSQHVPGFRCPRAKGIMIIQLKGSLVLTSKRDSLQRPVF